MADVYEFGEKLHSDCISHCHGKSTGLWSHANVDSSSKVLLHSPKCSACWHSLSLSILDRGTRGILYLDLGFYLYKIARRAGSDGSMSASGLAGPGFDPRQGSKFSFENFQPWG